MGGSMTAQPIHELSPEKFERVRALVGDQDIHAELLATLSGHCRGRVWVDRLDHPSAALVMSQSHNGYCLGDAPSRGVLLARQLIERIIGPWGQQLGAVRWSLRYPSEWHEALSDALADRHPIADSYLCLQYDADQTPPDGDALPEGYRLLPVDAAFLAQCWRHSEALDNWIRDCWASQAAYLAYGLGYAVVHGDEIVSHCMAEYPTSGAFGIGVDTTEGYRRRGWGTRVSRATVRACLDRGKRVLWHCHQGNVASEQLARNVGLEPLRRYPVLYAWYNPLDQLVVNGNTRLWAGDPCAALPWYQCALSDSERRPEWLRGSHLLGKGRWAASTAFQMAKAHALCQQPKRALLLLRIALTKGWTDWAAIDSEPALRALRSLPEWCCWLQPNAAA